MFFRMDSSWAAWTWRPDRYEISVRRGRVIICKSMGSKIVKRESSAATWAFSRTNPLGMPLNLRSMSAKGLATIDALGGGKRCMLTEFQELVAPANS